MSLQVYVNTRDRFGRVTGRRLVSAELHTLNRRTAWVRIGDRIVKRKLRRDLGHEDALRLERAGQ